MTRKKSRCAISILRFNGFIWNKYKEYLTMRMINTMARNAMCAWDSANRTSTAGSL